MKPRRTHESTTCFGLAGHNEDHDLWATKGVDEDGDPFIESVWELSQEERNAIWDGANVALRIATKRPAPPPVALYVTEVALGKKPNEPD